MKRLFLSTALLMLGLVGSMINDSLSIINCPYSHAASIGTWKTYMAYHDVTEIEQGGNIVYVLASKNLYTYNTGDQSIHTYDKVNGLSDCNIAHIAWCQNAKRLVIIYENQNIDLLDTKGNITNISDYYSKNMTDDKTINDIFVSESTAYLSTGFGVMKVNVSDAEISNTYNLGFPVQYTYTEGNYLYAASATKGLYQGDMRTNLLDKNNWKRVGEYTERTKTLDPELLALVNSLQPGGPKYNLFGFMQFLNGQLYTCGGIFGTSFDEFKPGTIQILKDDEWTIYQDNLSELTGHLYVDLAALDVDPTDPTHVVASGRTGIYEFHNGSFTKHHNLDNSPLHTAYTIPEDTKDYVMAQGLKFDKSGNLFCPPSFHPSETMLELTHDGEWKSHHKNDFKEGNNGSLSNMTNMILDSRGIMWFVNNHWNTPALLCYQPSTDASERYTSFINEDGTKVSAGFVRCVAEDKSGNLWIGTDVGPLMLEKKYIGESSSTTIFNQVKVPRNDGTNYADYLLAGVDITCIAVDGGGRKWFGTNGLGVYLISEDNMEQVQHFTTANSSLISNYILAIAINPISGEVFFGTDKGLCSYMSDATISNEEMTTDNVYAYPNPVRPDYTGLITVTGLTYNADVKIVTVNGTLVTEGRSNGGTFTWDGNDQKGRRVASGVYMVETATEDGKSGTVCKIAIVN